MISVNDSIKNAYKKYTTQRKSYIQVGDNSFFVENLDVVGDCYNEGNVIGNAIARIAKFDIETDKVKGLDEFELFDGIWTGNQYEYISLGTFKLFNEEGTDDFFSSITAYDQLILFNKEYDPSKTTFPTTVYGLLSNICNQAGVELENETIPNGEQILNSNIFVENETLKIILNAICQISGNYAIARNNNKIKLLLKSENSFTLEKSEISNPEYKRTTWKINQVVLGMKNIEGEYVLRQDEADIEENGVHKLVVNDNPFVYTQDLREKYIDELFNQVKGFGYTAFSANWEGLPYIEIGDLVNIDGKESIVLRYNLRSPQGLDSTIEAPSIIDSVVKYIDNSNSIKNQQKRTEFSVDKAKAEINVFASTTEEITGIINSVNLTLNDQQARMDVLSTNIDESNGDVTSVKTGKGFSFDDKGLNISDPESDFNTQITNESTQYKNGDEVITETSKDGFMTTDLKEKGTHRYSWNGSDYDMVAERIEVDGEYAYAHFYNGGDL